VTPAKSSCPRSLSDTDVIVRKAPRAILAMTAVATPVHKGFRVTLAIGLDDVGDQDSNNETGF
jgi:hypothetical protein